jgi:hypothetical protein
MSEEFAWLTEHSRDISTRYAGKWIAVLDGKVIGVGATATEAAGQAEEEYPDSEYVLESVDPEPERV